MRGGGEDLFALFGAQVVREGAQEPLHLIGEVGRHLLALVDLVQLAGEVCERLGRQQECWEIIVRLGWLGETA